MEFRNLFAKVPRSIQGARVVQGHTAGFQAHRRLENGSEAKTAFSHQDLKSA